MEGLSFEDLNSDETSGEDSATIRGRVTDTFEIQKKRFKDMRINFNSEMSTKDIRVFCELGEKEEELFKESFEILNLSARGYHRILRCARTIADMDHSDRISCVHLSEAIGYRSAYRGLWNV